jgi:hypothetical protein
MREKIQLFGGQLLQGYPGSEVTQGTQTDCHVVSHLTFRRVSDPNHQQPRLSVFFPSGLAELQEREMAVHKRLNGIPAVAREPKGPEDTPEKLEEERLIAQEFIDTGTPLAICRGCLATS